MLQAAVEGLVEAVEVLGGQDRPQPLAFAFAVIAAPVDELLQGRQSVQRQRTLEAREGLEQAFQSPNEHQGLLELRGLGQQAEACLGGGEPGQGFHEGLLQPSRLAVVQQAEKDGTGRRAPDGAERLHGFQQELTPMWEKYRVTAGLFGHDHNYQHYLKNGVHYVVSGGGGAPLYDVNKPDPAIARKVASIENFVSVSVNGKTARVQAIDIDGKVLEEFEFRAAGQ